MQQNIEFDGSLTVEYQKNTLQAAQNLLFLCQKNSESFYIAKSYINNEGKSTSVNVRKLGTLKELLIKHGPHTLCSTMPDIPYFRSLFPYH